jgi:hypothetical protein
VSAFQTPVFSRPPRAQIENGSQIAIDRISVPAGLAVVSIHSQPPEVLLQGLLRIGDLIINSGGSIEVERRRVTALASIFSFFKIHAAGADFNRRRLSH